MSSSPVQSAGETLKQPKPRSIKPLLLLVTVVILAAGGGAYLISWIVDYRKRQAAIAEMLEMERHLLGPDNPPSPESFYPVEVTDRPPIVKGFQIVSAKQAAGKVKDNELVLAVEINGQARAYPLNVMTGAEREVFNDTLGGRAIAATW